jgi:hypothetical protein
MSDLDLQCSQGFFSSFWEHDTYPCNWEILPEIGNVLASLGNKKFYCLLLFFLSLPHIFNTVNNFWVKETGRCRFCCFSSEMFVLIQIGNFYSQIGKKVYMFCIWEHDRISAIKSTEKKTNPGLHLSQK